MDYLVEFIITVPDDAPPPEIDFRMTVRCDECGEEHQYDPADMVRFQMEIPSDFKPHPLFA